MKTKVCTKHNQTEGYTKALQAPHIPLLGEAPHMMGRGCTHNNVLHNLRSCLPTEPELDV